MYKTISDKIRLAEEKWLKALDCKKEEADELNWEAEDIQGDAYNDIEKIFNHINIDNDITFSDIIKDRTLDETTLIITIRNDKIVDIKLDTLCKLNDIFNNQIDLHFYNRNLFMYIDF